jgi:raffinose synthase
MYSIVLKDNKVNVLFEDKIVIEGLKPLISFDRQNPCNPELKGFEQIEAQDLLGHYKEYIISYGDEEISSLKTIFKCYQEYLITSVQLLQKQDVFIKSHDLLPVGGVKLQVESIAEFEGLMANYMYCNWWTRPFFGKDITKMPSRVNSLLWKDEKVFHHLLPLCDDIFKAELQGIERGMEIAVSAYTAGYKNCSTLCFILASGNNPFEVSKKITEAGFKILNTSGKDRSHRRYPEILEYLGWCSWDAFYHEVNSKGILDKAKEFKKLGLPLKWIMIDDGWSELKNRKLESFKEDRSKFPEGLANLIENLKVNYGVNWVGVWQAYSGYWNGIEPDSVLAKEMKDCLYTANSGMVLPYPDAVKGFGFWNNWHRYLKKQGVDFVKVDNQSSTIENYKGNVAVGKAARETHEGLEASVGINFDNSIINCMGMGLEEIWNRPISAVSRNSDDFYPRKENSFKEHALQNAYNSFYHGNFMWGDWDMWWTIHEQDVNNAVLRAVSGGPLYVSDGEGKTDANKLWPLILKDGRVLRCDIPGTATADCLVHNPNEEAIPLKVWNRSGIAGVVGVFNINKNGETVTGRISASDIPGMEGESFLVYSHFKKEARFVGKGESLEFTLKDNEVDLYLVIPVTSRVTPLGLVNKYISPATISSFNSEREEVFINLKEGGLFAFAATSEPKSCFVNGESKDVIFEKGIYLLDCSAYKGEVYIELVE